ncbi:MAG: anaerobic nitric oxide reductase flavorubredoxin, partial [Desulfamplus sp.]
KKAAAFGCYGWSGEAVKVISDRLKSGGFELLNDGLKEKWNPDSQSVENCINFGREIGSQIK